MDALQTQQKPAAGGVKYVTSIPCKDLLLAVKCSFHGMFRGEPSEQPNHLHKAIENR